MAPDHAVTIRRLGAADAELYRAIRLEGLEKEPHAFAATLEKEGAEPLPWFAGRLEARTVLAACESGQLLGVAGFHLLEGPKDRHKGVLFGMYVRPAARGRGVGAMLVEAVLAAAAGVVEQVQLTVSSDNEPARRLYARLGFRTWGAEPRARKHGDRYSDDIWMVKFLTGEIEETRA